MDCNARAARLPSRALPVKLPFAEHAIVDESKLRDYLLSPVHPVGRFKSLFFADLGYQRDQWRLLKRDLQRHACEEDAVPGKPSSFGSKFEIRGKLVGPNRRSATIVSIWIVKDGEMAPRFITAYPA